MKKFKFLISITIAIAISIAMNFNSVKGSIQENGGIRLSDLIEKSFAVCENPWESGWNYSEDLIEDSIEAGEDHGYDTWTEGDCTCYYGWDNIVCECEDYSLCIQECSSETGCY